MGCGCARTSPARAVPTRREQAEVLGARQVFKVLTEALQQQRRDCSTAARELNLQAGGEWGSGGGWGHRAPPALAEVGTAPAGFHTSVWGCPAWGAPGTRAAAQPGAKSPKGTGGKRRGYGEHSKIHCPAESQRGFARCT